MRAAFKDPRTGDVYQWARNHEREEQVRVERAVEELQPTAAGWEPCDPIRLQGDRSPLVRRLAGRINDRAQLDQFVRFAALCMDQTIYFRDVDGAWYEVLISTLEPQRVGVAKTRNGGQYVWDYTIEIETIRTL